MTTPETFLFITLPAPPTTGAQQLLQWNPQTETAYGSVDIDASGTTVTLNNISQHTLPSSGGTGVPSDPSPTSVTGACSSTVLREHHQHFGAGDNHQSRKRTERHTAGTSGHRTVGSASRNNGMNSSTIPLYENALGAGTGAIGLPKPSAAVNTGSLVSAQYLGFFFGTGTGFSDSNTNWSTSLASFGFSSPPASWRFDYSADRHDALRRRLHEQRPHVLYNRLWQLRFRYRSRHAGCSEQRSLSCGNRLCGLRVRREYHRQDYSFPAVAIAGQLNGKYAIFLIGTDSVGSPNQAWGIYLLQSN